MRAKSPENALSNNDHLIRFGFSIRALVTNELQKENQGKWIMDIHSNYHRAHQSMHTSTDHNNLHRS